MALADTANLLVKLSLGGNFLSQIGKATTGLNKFDKQLGRTEGRAFKAGQQIGTGIKNAGRLAAVGVGFLVSQVALGLHSLIELEKATAQTNAVIESTGGIAGVTGAEVTRLSEKFESLNALVGDEFIRAGQNMLLTFTNIRGKAFEPATQAILDMNTAMGKGPEGLTTTAILVGKALNDPIKGATALRRVGVQLNDQQVAQIKTLVKQNDLYGAQQVILKELNKEFGGSFAAQGGTTAAKVAKFADAIEDLQRTLAAGLLPVVSNVANALSKLLADPKVVKDVENFGKSLAGLLSPANLAEGGRILGEVFAAARAAAPTIAAAAQITGQVVGTAVTMFRSLPKEIQQLAIGAFAINKLTGGLVTNIAGGLISSVLKQLVSGVVNVRGASVIVTGGAGLPGGPVPVGGKGGSSKLGMLGSILGKVFIAGMAIEVISALAGALGEQSAANKEQAANLDSQLQAFFKIASKDQLENALEGITENFNRLNRELTPEGIAFQFDVDGVRTAMQKQIDGLKAEINRLDLAGIPGETFGPPTPGKKVPVRPTVVDSPRTSGGNLKDLEAILARGRAAGFSPTFAAAQQTHQRNLSRLAQAQIDKTNEVKAAVLAGDTRSEIAGVRNAIAAQRQLAPIVNVDVNVTASQVTKTVTIQNRYGPGNGSRGAGPRRVAEFG